MKKILCIGEALIDMICTDKGRSLSEGENFLKKPGRITWTGLSGKPMSGVVSPIVQSSFIKMPRSHSMKVMTWLQKRIFSAVLPIVMKTQGIIPLLSAIMKSQLN